MKIKLSKSRWEKAGIKAGWMKGSQSEMESRMDDFFSPKITLKRHMIGGKTIIGFWYIDLVKDLPLAYQFLKEAGIENGLGRIADSDLDAFEMAAGKHGYSIETIGE